MFSAKSLQIFVVKGHKGWQLHSATAAKMAAKSLQLVRDWYWGVQFHWNKVNTKEQNK